jgi:hypothetical protein
MCLASKRKNSKAHLRAMMISMSLIYEIMRFGRRALVCIRERQNYLKTSQARVLQKRNSHAHVYAGGAN